MPAAPRLLLLQQKSSYPALQLDSLRREFHLEIHTGGKPVPFRAPEPFPDAVIVQAGPQDWAEQLPRILDLVEIDPELPVIVILDSRLPGWQRLEILRGPVTVHLEEGVDQQELRIALARVLRQSRELREHRFLVDRDGERFPSPGEPALGRLRGVIEAAAAGVEGLIICGLPGCGRGHVAREIHRLSQRGSRSFLSLDACALSAEEYRSCLLGGRGPNGRRETGLLELVGGGTLLLENIDCLSDPRQAEWREILAGRGIWRGGQAATRPLAPRIIATAGPGLIERAEQGRFDLCLLEQFSAGTISMPSPEEFQRDLRKNLHEQIRNLRRRYCRPRLSLEKEAKDQLLQHSWPGGLGELRGTLELGILRSRGSRLSARDLHFQGLDIELLPPDYKTAKQLAVLDFKLRFFQRALRRADGVLRDVARASNLRRPSVSTMLKDIGLRAADFRKQKSKPRS